MLLRSNAVEVNMLLKTIKQTSSAAEKFRELHVPRTGPLETVVTLTGERLVSKYGSNNNILAYVPLRDSWVTLSDLHLPRHGHGAAVCQGSLYLVGGVSENVSAPSHMCRFSPLRNKWCCDVADLPRPVSFAAVVSLDNKLFVIGGKDCCNTALRKTQRYNPERNQWDYIADLNVPRVSHCATVLDDFIYVISGDKANFKSCERYDSTVMRWRLLPHMTTSRQQPAVHALGRKILVVGGYSGSNYRMHTTCEVFDPKKYLWSLVPGLGVPRAGCGITCMADQVYVFGGSNGRSILNTLDSVECYSEEDKDWRKVTVIPEAIVAPQVAMLRMPTKYLT
ncbi:kelch-like ECH-associated protein 1 [Stylophora pistillata]|uniref:kelch-like ECH-associated protein 1 n=1 Tax=Stylophora pistillata TaxID=50429 RepID=UPI000C054F09|nr:kelch-like ECH-associated protein 1 [Stylophora pistillata]